jgi:hypothetical protein
MGPTEYEEFVLPAMTTVELASVSEHVSAFALVHWIVLALLEATGFGIAKICTETGPVAVVAGGVCCGFSIPAMPFMRPDRNDIMPLIAPPDRALDPPVGAEPLVGAEPPLGCGFGVFGLGDCGVFPPGVVPSGFGVFGLGVGAGVSVFGTGGNAPGGNVVGTLIPGMFGIPGAFCCGPTVVGAFSIPGRSVSFGEISASPVRSAKIPVR